MKKIFNPKHHVLVIIFSLIIFIPLSSIIIYETTRDRRPVQMIDIDLVHFAYFTHMFDFYMAINGGERSVVSGRIFHRSTANYHPNFDASFTELVFVHNQEEAIGFSDNVVIAWPSETMNVQRAIDRINVFAARTEERLKELREGRHFFNIEDFGLTYPITIADLINNWEGVLSVWRAFSENERMDIRPWW